MGTLLGARDLGLKTDWRFGFVPFGFRAESTPGVVYVDVGGKVQPGVLDHHGEVGTASAASIVASHREASYNHLLGPWLERFPGGRIPEGTPWRPTIVTHMNPDWDGMVAAWFVTRLIEDGDLPHWAGSLVAYTLDVDQGRLHLQVEKDAAALFAPHIGYLGLQNMKTGGRKPSHEETIRRGFRLLEAAVAGIQQKSGKPPEDGAAFLATDSGATAWADQEEFADLRDFLKADREKFERDKAHRGKTVTITVPDAAGDKPIKAPVWIANRPTESALNKYWVRAEPCPVFVCPYNKDDEPPEGPGGPDSVFSRVVISIDETWKTEKTKEGEVAGRRPNLRGLGYALERAEAAVRSNDGTSAERAGPPRYPDGYCDNKDPWYDGRAHGWTIVDAPAVGSRLKYGELLRILTETRYWETPLEHSDLTMIWTDASAQPPDSENPGIAAFEGMSGTLETYARETRDIPSAGVTLGGDPRFLVETSIRHLPHGTCPPMTVVNVKSLPGATMEGLLALRDALIAARTRPPDYGYVRLHFERHFGDAKRREEQLRKLAEGDVQRLDELAAEGEVVLFNGRSILMHGNPVAKEELARKADLEVLLYAAFLNETLVALSEALAGQLGKDASALSRVDTSGLLTRMLAFQTRYYQLEVSRLPRGRTLFSRLYESLRLSDHYAEVQAELDRLSTVQTAEAEKRASKASRMMEFFLAVVAVAGAFQTVIAFFTMEEKTRRLAAFQWSIGTVALLSIAVLIGVNLYRWQKKRNGPSGPKKANADEKATDSR